MDEVARVEAERGWIWLIDVLPDTPEDDQTPLGERVRTYEIVAPTLISAIETLKEYSSKMGLVDGVYSDQIVYTARTGWYEPKLLVTAMSKRGKKNG